ncbi:lipid A ethanolaminephosphotransferase [Rhizobium mesoamericanum]|uniref:phosphoethanolamine transferase n=1 Tax=Rhizobium mesoamericanum TaxID=1079800 RepID=UPI002789C73D|nr:phosphoethanolamine--lipid A transferase [Rhizobium mesoamericanum]MDQ0562539.1 lipid A ethanolaminephosphotransferase [Rhizobium mesoamericanum]
MTKVAASKSSLQPEIGSIPLCILTSFYILVFCNNTFWKKATDYLGSGSGPLWALYLAMLALFVAAITPFSTKYLIKPFLIFLVLVAAAASHFTDTFGVMVDSDMIRNAMETTPAEARHLITSDFIVHVAIWGIVPSILIIWVKVDHRPFMRKVLWNLAAILFSLAVFTICGVTYSREYTAAIRERRDIAKSFNPVTPIVSTARYFMSAGNEASLVVQTVGADATVRPSTLPINKPRVTIIVAGETARAENFSLGGYQRGTNPRLKAANVIYFPNTTSCGTATATSIPCMFSRFTRSEFTHAKAMANENLADVLAHAGIGVAWFDNNTGDKGVAKRIKYVDLANSKDPRFCQDGECLDGIFLDRLDEWLDQVKGDSVLVLHQLGSHGPTYYRRYPEHQGKFVPDCRTPELGKCSTVEIVNAYDNSILYTDYFLATVIDRLKARSDKMATGLIYMSDHGESLGEKGLYLHGTPYMFAPSQQTHVPFLTWFDSDFAKSMNLDTACLRKEATAPTSHDNLFHSVLSMMNVETSVYDKRLDVFAKCRTELLSIAPTQRKIEDRDAIR